MEKYKLIGIKNKTSKKSNKNYFLAYILLENDYGFTILNTMIKEKQVEPLLNAMNDSTFDLNNYLSLNYNSYNKQYQLTITYGL